jgi:hypothetical protein
MSSSNSNIIVVVVGLYNFAYGLSSLLYRYYSVFYFCFHFTSFLNFLFTYLHFVVFPLLLVGFNSILPKKNFGIITRFWQVTQRVVFCGYTEKPVSCFFVDFEIFGEKISLHCFFPS